MIERIVSELGPWNWMVLGFVLIVMEIVAPGVFMLWIGIAALIAGKEREVESALNAGDAAESVRSHFTG